MVEQANNRNSTFRSVPNFDSEYELLAELSNSDSWEDSSSGPESDDCEEFDAALSDVATWCCIDGADHAAPPRFPFTGAPGIKVDVELDNPLAYLRLFLTDAVIEKIVTETNQYQEQRSVTLPRKWSCSRKREPVTKDETWKFLAMIILQGVVAKPMQKWYWITNKLLVTPFFGTVMPEYRFALIMKFLHFVNNEEFDDTTHPSSKLCKIWDVYQMIVANFQRTYVPERDITLSMTTPLIMVHMRGGKDIMKPQVVVDYNSNMGGVDRADQAMTFYPAMRKQQKKYYKKIFRHILEQCLWNAYILQKKASDQTLLHLDFIWKVAECIFLHHHTPVAGSRPGRRTVGVVSPEHLTGRHFVDHIPPTERKSVPTRMCVLCCSKRDDKGKKIRKETRFHSPDCDVGLCAVPCFKIYHTKDVLLDTPKYKNT
uniref:PiggyBac transposable element-derived protein 4 n=1 Tax=Leptobrachium leishanense TaxID=445787 RepID=A0A8C5LXP6_9ANUR